MRISDWSSDVCSSDLQGGRKNPQQEFVQVNTKDILFSCGGAFAGLERIIAARMENKSIGFGASVDPVEAAKSSQLFAQRKPDDLVKFGLLPELTGGLRVTRHPEDPSKPMTTDILTNPKTPLSRHFQTPQIERCTVRETGCKA